MPRPEHVGELLIRDTGFCGVSRRTTMLEVVKAHAYGNDFRAGENWTGEEFQRKQ